MTECEDVAEHIRARRAESGQVPFQTIDEARDYLRRYLYHGETETVLDNVAWALVHG